MAEKGLERAADSDRGHLARMPQQNGRTWLKILQKSDFWVQTLRMLVEMSI